MDFLWKEEGLDLRYVYISIDCESYIYKVFNDCLKMDRKI